MWEIEKHWTINADNLQAVERRTEFPICFSPQLKINVLSDGRCHHVSGRASFWVGSWPQSCWSSTSIHRTLGNSTCSSFLQENISRIALMSRHTSSNTSFRKGKWALSNLNRALMQRKRHIFSCETKRWDSINQRHHCSRLVLGILDPHPPSMKWKYLTAGNFERVWRWAFVLGLRFHLKLLMYPSGPRSNNFPKIVPKLELE